MRGIRALGALTGLATVLTVSACSSGANPADLHATSTTFTADDPTSSAATSNPSASTSPSPGAVVSTDKSFDFVVPAGWNLTTNPKAVAYLSSATMAHNVAPTIAVTKSTASPAPAPDDAVQMAMMQARQDAATTNKLPGRTIGGEKAGGFTSDTQEKGVSVQRTYYVVVHGGTTFTVALTAAKADAEQSVATLNSMLSSWTWTKSGDANSTASGTTPAPVPTSTSSSSSASASGSSPASSASTPGKASPTSPTSAVTHGRKPTPTKK